MAVITEDELRSLAAVRSDQVPVTTCYLDVDGRRFVRQKDFEQVFDTLVRRTRATANGSVVEPDLRRIEEFIRSGVDRKGVRGLAIFSCEAADLWRVYELPVPVRSQIILNPAPAVGQLESVVQQAEAIGVLAADRQHSRVFVFDFGELVERTEELDELPRDYDEVNHSDRGGVDHHREELAHQHLRHAADLAWRLYQSHPFQHLALIAPDPIVNELEADLHPYLRERLRGRIDAPVTVGVGELRDRVLDLEARIEREREAALVQSLRDAVGEGRGVAGLDDVLTALTEHRIERLLVSDGFARPGWECGTCGRIAAVGRTCTCGAEMTEVDDVVEEAVEHALRESCRVEICLDNADLDVLGRIGALLRY